MRPANRLATKISVHCKATFAFEGVTYLARADGQISSEDEGLRQIT